MNPNGKNCLIKQEQEQQQQQIYQNGSVQKLDYNLMAQNYYQTENEPTIRNKQQQNKKNETL